MNWIDFEQGKGGQQELPPKLRKILCQVDAREEIGLQLPPTVAVGYLKYRDDDPELPQFIVPGVGGPVVAWCDCLGDNFTSPLMHVKNWWERIK